MEYDLTDGTQKRRKFIAIKSIQIFLFAGVILLTLVITVLCIGFMVRYEVETEIWDVDRVPYYREKLTAEQKFWFDDGIYELRKALRTKRDYGHASSAIIFLTHGIGAAAQAAVRFGFTATEVKKLNWENFEHFGRILQPCNASSICDAFTFATSMFGGIRTTTGLGGLDSAVSTQNCTQSMNELHQIKSILQMAQQRNLRTGFVTTQRVSGPIMAALYAHTPDTSWECDTDIPAGKLLQGCKDIATQLIDDKTGENINVIMGGGRQTLWSNTPISSWDPLDVTVCKSEDGRNYLREWRAMKISKQQNFALLQNAPELNRLNGSKIDYTMGIFANGNIKPPWLRNSTENYMPELKQMVKKALEVLKRREEGFLLVVESGKSGIDIVEQINILRQLNETINEASKFLSDDTLMVVLLNNLPAKNITSYKNSVRTDGFEEQIIAESTNNFKDINIFAKGPSSYLFKGIYEETYLAHAISYALKMGQFQDPFSKEK